MGRRRTYRDFEFIKRRFAPSGALGYACDINIRTSLIQLNNGLVSTHIKQEFILYTWYTVIVVIEPA